jgi:tetratricopeptide (TPR) repeat protein
MKSAPKRLQRAGGILLAVVVVLLLADSAFLAMAATPDGLVAPMLNLHLWLGLALCVALPVFVASHFVLHRRHRNGRARRIGLVTAALAGLGCAIGLGLWLGSAGAGARPELVFGHELAFVVALVAYVVHRLWAKVTPALKVEWIGVGAALVILGGLWTAQRWGSAVADPGPARAAYGPGLSQAQTVDGHMLGPAELANPEYCAECHAEIAERWAASAHHFSSLNDPFYAATLAVSQAHRSPDQIKFCGGCHDPLLLLTGRMDSHPRPGDPGADEGITCLACHAIVEAPGLIGNGSYVVAAPEHYPGFTSEDPAERALANRLLRSKPAKHVASFGPAHIREPRLCLACHKAHIPPQLNAHRWVRGQNEWDPWFDSGAGGHSARTFYPPKAEQVRCQDCHMPKIPADDPAAEDGKVADHAFLGANTALPAVLGDREWLARAEAFVADGVVSVDVGAVELGGRRQLAPAGVVALPEGEAVTVDVVVRNTGSGHLFPGGIADLREVWLELSLVGDDGEVLAASGWLGPNGELDPNAHRWNATLLDAEGEPLAVHEVEETYVVLSARRIMLGAADVVRVSFEAPAQRSRLELRVLHRKFPRDYVEFALGEDAPRMPITVMAKTELELEPGVFEPRPAAASVEAGARLRALGIAYLLRGDTALARVAVEAAAERRPEDPGPQLDLARASLADGALAEAEAHVRAADALAPGHPTAAWLLARIRASRGEHEGAIAALDLALAEFPRDRELLVMKGESLFRLERDVEAAEVLAEVLAIDPEHLGAHALLTRIHAERGDEEVAARHLEAWDRVRPRSDDEVVTERARREHPELDRRANRHYVLPLAPVPVGWERAPAG